MRGEPVAAEASTTVQQPEACCVFSRGGCTWIMGPWLWWAAQDPRRGGVDSDLCSHTGFLVAAAAALHFMPFSGVRADSHGSCPSLKLV